jgi:hypothetical protein
MLLPAAVGRTALQTLHRKPFLALSERTLEK